MMKNLSTYLNSMKNKLFLLVLLFVGTLVNAQTYTTGVVSLSSTAGLAMTAKMDVGTQVTLTLTGPATRWFAIGFDATSMGSGNDVVIAHTAGTLSSFDASIGGYSAPTTDPQQNWTIVSDAVASGVRTIVATRALVTGDANDHDFTAATGSLSLIWARAGSASFGLSYHGSSNRGISNATFTLVPPPPPPAAPTGSAAQSFCTGAQISQLSATGSNIQWYASPTGGTPLSGTTVLVNGVTYYASQTVNSVQSTNRLAVTVTINNAPIAPSGITGAAHFCYDGSESYSIWTTPNGATGSSIGTTLNLLFSPSFVSGTMSVLAQNACGQSPAVSLTINQHLAYANTLNISSCGSYSFNGQTYTQSGTYPYQGSTIWGCDSTVVLNLSIVQAYNTNQSESACGNYDWNGQSFSQSGVYVDTLQSISGCDSIVNLNLTIVQGFTTNVTESACGNYPWNGQTLWQSGVYIDTLQSVFGCDSTVTLNLTVNPIYSILIDSTVFDEFTWNGQVYTTSALHTQFFTSMNGCDSVVTIDLIIEDSGLNENEEAFFVYPNPLNGNQTLYISGITSGTFRVFDLNGSELRSGIFTSQIDLQGIQPGVYYVIIGSQRKRITIVG
jgi:hypothetical protein